MRKIKRIRNLFVVTAFMATFLVSLIGAHTAEAAVDTCTWTGATNSNMSNGGNWSGCDNGGVPEDGDSLIFPNVANKTVTNDLPSNTSFANIEFTSGTYTLTGNDIDIPAGESITASANNIDNISINLDINLTANTTFRVATDSSIFFSNASNSFISTAGFTLTTDVGSGGQISYLGTVGLGAGGIIKDGSGSMTLSRDNSYSGSTVINDGIVFANNVSSLGTSASGTQVNDGAALIFQLSGLTNGSTIDEPLTLNGEGNGDVETLRIDTSGSASDIEITSTISLASSDVNIGSDISLIVSGIISGSGAFTYTDFQNADDAYLKLAADNTYSGSTVINRTFIINGNQPSSSVTVPDGKTLKGTGTVGTLIVQSGGTLAPGESPGCLDAGDTTINGSFEIEIAGKTACSKYDRLRVTGSLDLNSAELSVSFLNGFKPKAGDKFTIITNDGTDKTVSGTTFADLNNGATFKVSNITFKISYLGGNGNDIVLTVVDVDEEAPGTPNTGAAKGIKANPVLTGAATLISSGSIALIVRRLRLFS